MANTVYEFGRSTDAMAPKVRALAMIREAVSLLTAQRSIELQRRGDTDGSDDAHYAKLAVAGSFVAGGLATANAAARASFETIDELWFKMTTNASITDMAAAISNACAKHGV